MSLTRRLSLAVAAALAGTAFGGPAQAAPDAATPAIGKPATVIDGAARYLVRYAPGTDVASERRSLGDSGVEVRRTFGHAVKAAAVTATPAQAAALARSPRVEAVELDARVQTAATQDAAPWGLDRVDQRNLPLSTTFTSSASGSGVEAYVVDTGVLGSHVDFGGRVVAGWTAIDDGRGTTDCNGHGTHVAGTVAGGKYGVAKAATIIPVRVLDCEGSGYMSGVIAGLDWVVARHAAGTPAVVNISLGGETSSTVDAAVAGAIKDGVVAVVAAGNSGTDACRSSPARVAAAITVAATNSTDQQASFSNHGTCVDLYAPGVGIASAWHTSNAATAALSGTSMAAPHLAGVAAALLSQQPSLTPSEVANRLSTDATPGVVGSATSGTPNLLLYLNPADEGATEDPVAIAPEEPAAATPPAAGPGKFRAPRPVTKGAARVGATLKAMTSSWSPRPSFRYQWYANGKKITYRGNKSWYKVPNRYHGKRITVRVTGKKAGYVTLHQTSRPTHRVAKRR
jgi:subtilisin family serine protease